LPSSRDPRLRSAFLPSCLPAFLPPYLRSLFMSLLLSLRLSSRQPSYSDVPCFYVQPTSSGHPSLALRPRSRAPPCLPAFLPPCIPDSMPPLPAHRPWRCHMLSIRCGQKIHPKVHSRRLKTAHDNDPTLFPGRVAPEPPQIDETINISSTQSLIIGRSRVTGNRSSWFIGRDILT
jgi:hypothetical protein